MTIEDRVRDLVCEVGYTGPRDVLTADFPLIEQNVIDSLGIFQIVSMIEERFGVEVEDEELVIENFETIGAMSRLIGAKVPVAGQ